MEIFLDTVGLTRGVVIHHWDTDGLVSAALLHTYFRTHYPNVQLELFMPTITNYYLTDEQYAYLEQQQYQFVITCDLNFPHIVFQELSKRWQDQVYVFDHHHQTQVPPNVHYFNKPHPACASYIAECLSLPCDLLPVIAMVGDKEEAIQHDPTFYPFVREVMANEHLTFSQLLLARRLIDSNYIVDDYQGIAETITLLVDDPLAIMNDVRLQQNLARVAETVEQLTIAEPQKLSDRVWFWEITTSLNVLSHVTRSLARKYHDKIIFTRQLKNRQYTCYIRRRSLPFDVRTIITYAHTLGLNAGGKEEVAGIIIPEERHAEVFPKLRDELLRVTSELK